MKNVLEYLEVSADRYPEKIAFSDNASCLTYARLRQLAERIGSYICKNTYFNGAPIAVLFGKNTDSVAAFLGVVYSGNIYTIIDSHMPLERINIIFDNLAPAAVITDRAHEAMARKIGFSGPILLIEDAQEHAADIELLTRVRARMTESDPLYVLFTSGAAGIPKGVVVTHRNVISYISWFTDTFGISDATVLANQTPFDFSMSVTDIYATLCRASTLHIVPKQLFSFPDRLFEFLTERRVDTIYWVPSVLCKLANMRVFDRVSLPYLKRVLFAGEVMPARQLNYWIKNLPGALFANLFGPTETTDICTYYVIDREFADDEPIPIGRACDNCQVMVVGQDGDIVREPNREGELYVRGPFVALGYYNDPQKTAQSFVRNPFCSEYPEYVYRTGDLVKYNAAGELIYVARRDWQIKHGGYRIEPGEVESVAGSVPGVEACGCIYDAAADRLVLIYQGSDSVGAAVRERLKLRLPAYMLPDLVVKIDRMPCGRNGKIDRIWLKNNYKALDSSKL